MPSSKAAALLDGSMNLIDSMFVGEPLNIAAAHVDQDGRSVSKERSEKVIGFDELRMQNLELAAYGVIVGRFLTREAPNRSVALRSGDVVDFRMGAKLKFK